MKAKDFLKWFIQNEIENTDSDYINIPDDEETETQKEFLEVFFGATDIKKKIPGGEYVYIWWNENNSDAILKILDSVEMIVHNGEDPIYLFRIED